MSSLYKLPQNVSEFWYRVTTLKESSIDDVQQYIQHLADHNLLVIETFINKNMIDVYLVIDNIDNKTHAIQTISDKNCNFNLFRKDMTDLNYSDTKIMFPFTLDVHHEIIQFPILFDKDMID
jgi:hypothetical protein